MAKRILFDGTGDGINDDEIHFVGVGYDYTLCGLTMDGDTSTSGGFNATKGKVNCKQCIEIVLYSKSIKKSEFINQTPSR